jgi:hypothetical protein
MPPSGESFQTGTAPSSSIHNNNQTEAKNDFIMNWYLFSQKYKNSWHSNQIAYFLVSPLPATLAGSKSPAGLGEVCPCWMQKYVL